MLLALALSATPSTAVGPTELIPKAPAEQTAPEIKETEQPKKTIPNLITYSTKLSEKLIDLQSQLADIIPSVNVHEEILKIEEALESLNWQAMMLQADSNVSYKQLSKTVALFDYQQDNLNDISDPLNETIKILAEQEEHWNKERDTLITWVETLKNKDTYTLVEDNITELQTSIESAVETIDSRMSESLAALYKVSGLQVKLYNLRATAGNLLSEVRREGWQQTSPSIFSGRFYSILSTDFLLISWQRAMAELKITVRQIRNNISTLLLILLLPFLFSIVFIYNRKSLENNRNWAILTSRPIAFSVFTCFISIFPWLEPTVSHVIPVISIALIFSVMLLAGKLEKKSIWNVRFIYALSLYLVINTLVNFINLPLPLKRIYLLVGSCCWLAYLTWRLSALQGPENRYPRWALIVMSLALIAVILAGIFGYDALAVYLFDGAFLTIYIFISCVFLFTTIKIIFELVLSLLPVTRNHTDVIVRALQPLIFALCGLLFYALVGVVWYMYPTSREAVSTLSGLEITLGYFRVPMNHVFMIVGIIYGAILSSRAIQAILLDEVMPRYRIGLGAQLSISRLIHYTILLIGFIILLKALGLDLTKLTILGGALSVGIGFGLQTIVNNFASGLILLFERPIKVGDTIALGTDLGEVKKLGLRSTIIQTFDNASSSA